MRLQIEKIVYGGAGLAHQEEGVEKGKAVFVPFTLPGEMVEVQLSQKKSGYSEARLLRVIEASRERVAAGCPHFTECGGCQLQHAQYPAQLRIKKEILTETLERAGLTALPEIEAHSGEPWEYRNRIRLRVATIDDEIRMGYNRRGSEEFLPIEECLIAATLLWRASTELLRLSKTDKNAERWLRAAVEIELFTDANESKLQMNLFVRKAIVSGFNELCERLKAEVHEFVGAGVSVLAEESAQRRRRTERPAAGARWGADGIQYRVAGIDYWVSRGGFFQVNRWLIDKMVRVVTGGRSGQLAWDLYAGVGLFSRVLMRNFAQVVAVEGSPTAVVDLAQGLKGKGVRAINATTVDFLRDAVVQRERPELIVLDPPRAGAGVEVCELLARVKAPEIVYVSCDPVTLSRDLRAMVDSGYKVTQLHLMDMFPQTFHLETVAVLRS
jgi:23S rRNA (uracil1939-C5)-methyltransferase